MSEQYKRTYRELLETIEAMGYPNALAKEIAKNLGSEKLMRRMIGYLRMDRPTSAEQIVDEMLALMSDRERWIQKKEAEEANAAYNRILNQGLDGGI